MNSIIILRIHKNKNYTLIIIIIYLIWHKKNSTFLVTITTAIYVFFKLYLNFKIFMTNHHIFFFQKITN